MARLSHQNNKKQRNELIVLDSCTDEGNKKKEREKETKNENYYLNQKSVSLGIFPLPLVSRPFLLARFLLYFISNKGSESTSDSIKV